MNPFKGLRSLLLKSDFFYTTELLRYNEESDFRTLTGGICSLCIIVIVCILFVNLTIQTFNKNVIGYTYTANVFSDPPKMTMQMNNNSFMFGLELLGIDLNNGSRYFDVVATYETQYKSLIPGQSKHTTVTLPLVPCTKEHWGNNPEVQSNFDAIKMYRWLCPELNSVYDVIGKYSTTNWTYMYFSIQDCTNASNPNRPCHPQQEISDYIDNQGSIYYTLYFMNPLINPSDQSYLNYYMEDNNYIQFSNQMASSSFLMVSQYEIQTDQSIMPYTIDKKESGPIIQNYALQYPAYKSTNEYAGFLIQRSSRTVTYKRQFQKFDYVFSYVGGLFGAIIGIMFIMKSYTGMAFEIALGSQMFCTNEGEKIEAKNFHIFQFFGYFFYKISALLGRKCNWKLMEVYEDCRYEIQRQLDIKFFIQRISFLERGLQMLCDDHQFKGLHLQKKITLNQAKKGRQYYNIKTVLKQKTMLSIPLKDKTEFGDINQKSDFEASRNQKSSNSEFNIFKSSKVGTIEMYSQNEDIQKKQKGIFFTDLDIKKEKCQAFSENLSQNIEQTIRDSDNCSVSAENRSMHENIDYDIKQLKESAKMGDAISRKILKNLQENLFEEKPRNQTIVIERIDKIESKESQNSDVGNEGEAGNESAVQFRSRKVRFNKPK